ncbi:MAG: very short patch repair endonuclease [Verrucomicrobia bacterium]|nr:very short patch repair endonuclease [Verrucomicrobiota bacterium]
MTGHDRLSKERRSWNMSRIRGKDTGPERVVRTLLHRMGYRFRLHGRKLPGQPDIVLPKYRTVVFVHGCFWHRHRGCRNCTTPTNRRAWWVKKLEGNAARDKVHARALRKLGWRVVVVWECETEAELFAEELERRVAEAVRGRRGRAVLRGARP